MIVYCSKIDVQNILSDFGVLTREDDDGDGIANDGAITEAVLQHATNIYNRYVIGRYTVNELAPGGVAVDSVRLDTAVIAAKVYCRRRANPVPDELETWYDEILAWLKQVGSPTSAEIIPGVVGLAGKAMAPSTRNYHIDLRHRTAITRVEKTISSEPPDRMPEFPADIFPQSFE